MSKIHALIYAGVIYIISFIVIETTVIYFGNEPRWLVAPLFAMICLVTYERVILYIAGILEEITKGKDG